MPEENEGIAVRLFDKRKVVLEEVLGSGSFGKVYKATISEASVPSTVAVKIFRKELKKGEVSQRQKDTAYEELLKVAVLNHENIVKLHGMVQDGSGLPWLVFEFMEGNLLEYVIKNDNIKEKTLIRFCRDICCAMEFLHKNHVLHKDLAARNILLNPNDKIAKIADLGLSSFLTHEEGDIYALNGKLFPYRHAARECIVEQIYTFESDVFSFGVLMHEIFNGGMTPYGKDNKQPEVRRFIVEGITPLHLVEPHCSQRIILVMKSILNPKMDERPSFQKLYKKFQKLLNGTFKELMSSNENSNPQQAASVAQFHMIKKNLSSSINNLQAATSGTNSHVLLSSKTDSQQPTTSKGFLTVSENYSSTSKSSSTPDIVNAVEASANTMQILANNFLSVRSLPGGNRRHSLAKLDSGEIPLLTRRNSDFKHSSGMPENLSSSPKPTENIVDESRRRANSGSRIMNNPLLEGFVKNRFARKQ